MNHALAYLDDVRRQIAPDDVALKEAAARRDAVRDAALRFRGALRTFASGSLAHRTANCPVHTRDIGLDADCGVVLDRRSWSWLGPDSATQEGPRTTLRMLVDHLRPLLRRSYPNVTLEVTKRAILIKFHAPLPGGEDPTVDLVLALDRRDQPGLWIPNSPEGPREQFIRALFSVAEVLTTADADPSDQRRCRAEVLRQVERTAPGTSQLTAELLEQAEEAMLQAVQRRAD